MTEAPMRELYQVVEVGPGWYQDNIPCQEACPVKTNCRGYLNLAAAGEFEKGWELALDPNPMASICGSVCAAPCETACRRKEVDKPLSIRYVKKFLSDWTHQNVTVDGRAYTQPPAPVFGPPRGKVAIVAAGCFEPNYIGIPGEESDGVMAGIVFLERAYRGRPVEVGKRVIVLGSGYTAMDCSSTSWRLGAEHMYVIVRRSREEMVVDEEELTETEREGIEFVYLASPVEVLADANGHVRGVVFIRNKLGDPDEKGRRSPVAIPGTEFEIPCDTVLLALGQAPETSWLSKEVPAFRVKRWRDIKVDPETYQTIVPKIFIGGDYRTAPTTIIEAVADGRSAAQQIARFLDENAVSVNVPAYDED